MSDNKKSTPTLSELPPAPSARDEKPAALAIQPTSAMPPIDLPSPGRPSAGSRDKLVGRILDSRFELQSLIGKGGMGRVYRGVQLSVGRDVAIKLLHNQAIADPTLRQRFLREARVISGFSHPNIVRLIDFGHAPEFDAPYLVMEYVDGVNLGDLLKRGRLRPDLAVEIAAQVCQALIEAHRAGVIHRDLKPDNLHLVTIAGGALQVKVLDFGIALPERESSKLTSTGMICGTAYYMAPEQARGEAVGPGTDLYALGVILFEMLSGSLPFQGDSDFQVLLQHVQVDPPPLTDFLAADQVPNELITLVSQLLDKSPDQRLPDAKALRRQLEDITARHDWTSIELDDEQPLDSALSPFILSAQERLDPAYLSADDASRQQAHHPSSAPPTLDASPPPTSSSKALGSKLPLLAVGLLLAVVAAAAAAFYITTQHDPPSSPSKESASITTPDNQAQNTATETAPLPLHHFAGRCDAVGEHDLDFNTVYFYPELGEILLASPSSLTWSAVQIGARDAESLEFTFQRDGQPVNMRVRSSSDKLIYTLGAPPDASRFVCQASPHPDYYARLDLDGDFRGDAQTSLKFGPSGQRLTWQVDQAAQPFTYRLLQGDLDGDGVHLAARLADDRSAPWQRWTISQRPDQGRLFIKRPDATYTLSSADAPNDRKPIARPPSKPKKTSTPKTKTIADNSTSQAPSKPDRGHYIPPADSDLWDKRLQKILNDCETLLTATKDYQRTVQQLADAKNFTELRAYQERQSPLQTQRSEKMGEVGKAFSRLVQEMQVAERGTSAVLRATADYQEKCDYSKY